MSSKIQRQYVWKLVYTTVLTTAALALFNTVLFWVVRLRFRWFAEGGKIVFVIVLPVLLGFLSCLFRQEEIYSFKKKFRWSFYSFYSLKKMYRRSIYNYTHMKIIIVMLMLMFCFSFGHISERLSASKSYVECINDETIESIADADYVHVDRISLDHHIHRYCKTVVPSLFNRNAHNTYYSAYAIKGLDHGYVGSVDFTYNTTSSDVPTKDLWLQRVRSAERMMYYRKAIKGSSKENNSAENYFVFESVGESLYLEVICLTIILLVIFSLILAYEANASGLKNEITLRESARQKKRHRQRSG